MFVKCSAISMPFGFYVIYWVVLKLKSMLDMCRIVSVRCCLVVLLFKDSLSWQLDLASISFQFASCDMAMSMAQMEYSIIQHCQHSCTTSYSPTTTGCHRNQPGFVQACRSNLRHPQVIAQFSQKSPSIGRLIHFWQRKKMCGCCRCTCSTSVSTFECSKVL